MRYYQIGNQFYPSVTTILSAVLPKKALTRWKERTPDWEKQQRNAQIVGTLIHFRILHGVGRKAYQYLQPIEQIPYNEIEECTPELLYRVEIGELMFNELGLKIAPPVAIEELVVNHEFRYAGRFDMLAAIDGQKTLVDIKTSKREYRSHLLQLGGYAMAMDTFPERAAVIYLDYREESNPLLRPKLIFFSQRELKSAGAEFLACVDEFHERYPNGGNLGDDSE
jgi:hypothetical protein